MVCRPPGRLTHLPPASFRRSSLCPTLRTCAWYCSRVCSLPHCRPRTVPISPLDPGGFSYHSYLRVSVPLHIHPFVCSASRHIMVLGICFFSGVQFAQGKGSRAPPLPGSCSPRPPYPPLPVHTGVFRIPGPPPSPPIPPPPLSY